MASRLHHLLTVVTADAAQRLSSVDLLSADQRRWLAKVGRGTDTVVPELDLVERIQRYAAERPHAVAISGDDEITFGRLAERVRNTAVQLRAAGVQDDSIVAVLRPRSGWFVTMAAGVIAVGAAYLGLDPETPPTRRAQMIAASGARHLLIAPEFTTAATGVDPDGTTPQVPGVDVLSVESDTPTAAPAASGPSRRFARPAGNDDSLVYVVFTSGSTGVPKGVLVPRRGLANHFVAVSELYELGPRT